MPPPSPVLVASHTAYFGTSGPRPAASSFATWNVHSISFAANESEEFLDNGDGAHVALTLLADGFDATLEVVEDSAITFPAVGAAADLRFPGAGANVIGTITKVGDVKFVRKGYALRTVRFSYRPGITRTI